jgi:hypothetical protein
VKWLPFALLLTACATSAPEPIVQMVEVQVPVSVPCNVQVGADPDYPDTDEALKNAPSVMARVQLMVGGRLMRIKREVELNAAIAGCRGSQGTFK